MKMPRRANPDPADAVTSFAPVADSRARVLILGSMPGAASLASDQYYAHPRNAFWPIMGAIAGFDPALPYRQRLWHLQQAGFALWDVLHSCVRPGSLDSAIEPASEVANDFATFFRAHPRIGLVCFNGTAAQRTFDRHVRAALQPLRLDTLRLPSTSPAHAARSFEQKQAAWRIALLSAGRAPAPDGCRT